MPLPPVPVRPSFPTEHPQAQPLDCCQSQAWRRGHHFMPWFCVGPQQYTKWLASCQSATWSAPGIVFLGPCLPSVGIVSSQQCSLGRMPRDFAFGPNQLHLVAVMFAKEQSNQAKIIIMVFQGFPLTFTSSLPNLQTIAAGVPSVQLMWL